MLFATMALRAQCAPASVPTSTPCYTTVINDDPYCCNVMWDGICQSAYDACVASGGNSGGGGGTGCNTNTSICSNSAAAGPFFFAPASANPSSCLDFFNGQTAPNYAYIILYITTSGNLNLLIDANATGFLDVSIFDITGAADPCSSLSIATEIGCNYASATDGCAEFLRDKIGVMFGNPETTTGGNALKFYASVRIDIRRTSQIKEGDEVIGNRVKVKVVKNKVAPPFRKAEFDIMYGEGISKVGEIIDLGVDMNIIKKSGSWFSYGETKLGQGRDAVKSLLLDNPELMEELEEKIKDALGAAGTKVPVEQD